MKKIDVFILSGFLGSGKTTLLGNIIKQEKAAERRIAVLMNELGRISLDSYLIEEGIPLKELYDGCICCTLQDKVEVQLHDLLADPNLDAIYIETTGAAHPVEVLDAIMSPLLADKLNYKGILTVVDLLRWSSRDTLSPQIRQLLLEQIYHADLILLNKTDLVSELEAAQRLFEIQSLNSKASILLTKNAEMSLKQISQMNLHPKEEHSMANMGHQLKLQTILYEFTNEISQTSFEDWIKELPQTVYRMKGFIQLKQYQKPVLFQYSYGTPLYMPQEMKLPLKLVIIGEELDTERIHQNLQKIENQS
ncbi:G3E family GTPase [Peribacillus deserti]|uniref:G3E family GTPase n=2 Tax=Peribacillus deserti TaxID=673318 RepID=A0ABS2QJQ0_9BACI|nr:GTP-binding protein [Peribacillus deserti]MBM7692516.1 G3E family GTPase [Peribacillus deserti]